MTTLSPNRVSTVLRPSIATATSQPAAPASPARPSSSFRNLTPTVSTGGLTEVGLAINQVDPSLPVEGQKVRISYTIDSGISRAASGSLTAYFSGATGGVNSPSVTVPVPRMGPAQSRDGVLELVAPRAGKYSVEALFYSDDPLPPGVEVPAPVAHASVAVDVAARFMLSVDWVRVRDTRSPHEDTDFVFAQAGRQNQDPLTAKMSMGDVNNGTYPTNLHLGPFLVVPGNDDSIMLTYSVVNSGYAASGEAQAEKFWDAVSKGGKDIATAYFPLLSGAWDVGDMLNQLINSVALQNYDGVVAAETVLFNTAELDTATIRDGYATWTRRYTRSAPLGNASHYDVSYSLQRSAVRYRITVKTGDVSDAGTDSNIFITLKGSSGASREIQLDTMDNNFERGATETFEVVAQDVGDIVGIVVRSDGSGDYSGWYLDEVTVATDEPWIQAIRFVNKQGWLDSKHGLAVSLS